MTIHSILCDMTAWYLVAVVTLPYIAYLAKEIISSIVWKRRLAREEQAEMKALLAYYERGMYSGH